MSQPAAPAADDDDEPFDPDASELCADGACNGLIGPGDRCKVCGLHKSAAPPSGDFLPAPFRAAAEPAGDPDGDELAFDDRRLCSDGACTGLLGADGRCKECGRPG